MADLRPYLHLARIQARAQASYRASFVIDLFVSIFATGFEILTVLVFFRGTTSIGGFTIRETMVITGLCAAGFAIADAFVGGVDRLSNYVRNGHFDAMLLRPLRPLPQLLLAELPLRKITRVALGVLVLVVALLAAPITWTPGRIVLAVVAPLAASVFYSAIFVATASISFWWIESGEAGNALTYGGRDLTTYPMTIYGTLFRRVLGFGLGFAFVTYYPALALLGRPDPLGLPSWVGWTSPISAVVVALAAAAIWRLGITRYRSTGS